MESGIECVTGKKFHTSRADGHGLSDFNSDYFGFRHIRIFLLAPLNHDGSEVLCVDRRRAEARQGEGNAADMVEVAVRNNDALHAACILLQIFRVGEDVVNAGEVSSETNWKPASKTRYRRSLHLDGGHVAAHFLHPAKRDDADRRRPRRFWEVVYCMINTRRV